MLIPNKTILDGFSWVCRKAFSTAVVKVPVGDNVPTAGDCYRFNLTNPAVDLCLTGPRSASDLTAALDTLDKGPMTPEEMDWMRRVGQAKYHKPSLFSIKG